MMTTKLRSQLITIELPTETAEPWVRATIQTVLKDADYETVQTIDRTGAVHRTFRDFVAMEADVIDPITGQVFRMSGAAVAEAISTFVKQWMLQDIAGTRINARGDVVKG